MESPPLCNSSGPVRATGLIATLNHTFKHSEYRALRLDYTSIILLGPNVEQPFVGSIYNHAVKRQEDQSLLVLPTDQTSSTAFLHSVSQMPGVSTEVMDCLNVLMPFFTALTPQNLTTRFHNGLAVTFTLNEEGRTIATRLQIDQKNPFVSMAQLLDMPRAKGNRAFDVFYYFLRSAEAVERKFASIKNGPQDYDLLKKSGTYELPSWVSFSEDGACASDWREALRNCGIKGAKLRDLISALSGILLLGNASNSTDIEEGALLLGLDPQFASCQPPSALIESVYVKLVNHMVDQLNMFLRKFDIPTDKEDSITVNITIAELANTDAHQVPILKSVFDNSCAINAEMIDDGIVLQKCPNNIKKAISSKETASLKAASLRKPYLEFHQHMDQSSILAIPASPSAQSLDVASLVEARVWTVLNVSPFVDAEHLNRDEWNSGTVSAQLRKMFATEWADRRKSAKYSLDFEYTEFYESYHRVLPANLTSASIMAIMDAVQTWASDRQLPPDVFFCGRNRIWLTEDVWEDLEYEVNENVEMMMPNMATMPTMPSMHGKSILPPVNANMGGSVYNQSIARAPSETNLYENKRDTYRDGQGSDDPYDDDFESDQLLAQFPVHDDVEKGDGAPRNLIAKKMTKDRRFWVGLVYCLTFWIPSPFLRLAGMKREDVRMAWREKLVICLLIFLLNAAIIFYMIFLMLVICPDFKKVWDASEVSLRTGTNGAEYWVSIRGSVYDFSKFYGSQHSDNGVKTTKASMLTFAGQDLSSYFPMPPTVACPSLVTDESVKLLYNTSVYADTTAMHTSGSYYITSNTTELHKYSWYQDRFQPFIKGYYKGPLVTSRSDIKKNGVNNDQYVCIINNEVFDLTNYFITTSTYPSSDSSAYDKYNFLDSDVVSMFENNMGYDITEEWNTKISESVRNTNMQCMRNLFYAGKVDFRETAKCQVSNYILLALAAVLSAVVLVKFIASIRFGSKKMPAPQDKYVICQIPAYTEDEDALRLAIDSVASLEYENSKKLLFVICDGVVVGQGNSQSTAGILCNIFGIDDKITPPDLQYLAIGEGHKRENKARVYGGLYESDGNFIPYVLLIKCGNDTEQKSGAKPGNRGKRDSQIILMNFLNKCHYQKPMCPLELEIFRQINNVIGVDPELYEYVFMIDADTRVREDSLNRLVSACSNDLRIAGICGETALQNEEQSWTTMMQVYEYFISHHLTKQFESTFGSVTCLPGCFSLYRLRTAKKYKPLFICDDIIEAYSERHIDTLHKKNLFSLGEDRYLTTLIVRSFPTMKLSFIPDAHAYTVAPDKFSVLLSQRRRWINSTVHNLVELMKLNNMCGFFLFGMRGIVFIDLVGTLMLPSVVVYLGYLIYVLASRSSSIPIISIVLIGVVYGLQMLVFMFRRQWQHIGWMIIYLAAYPIHSFLLPIYSFWNMDNFSWGNTRIVVGQKGNKEIINDNDPDVPDSAVPEELWESYARRNNLARAARPFYFDPRRGRIYNEGFAEMIVPGMDFEMQSLAPSNINPNDPFRPPALMKDTASEVSRPFSRAFSHFTADLAGGNGSTPTISGRDTTLGNTQALRTYEAENDQELIQAISNVLADANLDEITPKQVRDKVSDMLSVSFAPHQVDHINELIDAELMKEL